MTKDEERISEDIVKRLLAGQSLAQIQTAYPNERPGWIAQVCEYELRLMKEFIKQRR